MYYLLLLLAVLGIAGNFSINKVYQKSVTPDSVEAYRKTAISAPLAALMFWCMSGFSISFSSFTVIMSALMAVVGLLSALVCFKGYVHGSIAVFTLFQMSGGMLLPFIYGIWYGNEVTPARIVGIVLMLASLVFPLVFGGAEKVKLSPKFIALCAAIFVINGSISVISYIYSNSPETSGSYSFLVLKSLMTMVISAAAWFIARARAGKKPVSAAPAKNGTVPKLGALIVAMTVADGLSYWLQLVSAAELPAVALYPMVTGGAVVFTAIAGAVFFREKMSKGTIIGIAMTLVATVLFMF